MELAFIIAVPVRTPKVSARKNAQGFGQKPWAFFHQNHSGHQRNSKGASLTVLVLHSPLQSLPSNIKYEGLH